VPDPRDSHPRPASIAGPTFAWYIVNRPWILLILGKVCRQPILVSFRGRSEPNIHLRPFYVF
jgi:hypothetical protein